MATVAQVLADIQSAPNWRFTHRVRSLAVAGQAAGVNEVYMVLYAGAQPGRLRGEVVYIHVHLPGDPAEEAWIIDWSDRVDRIPFIVLTG